MAEVVRTASVETDARCRIGLAAISAGPEGVTFGFTPPDGAVTTIADLNAASGIASSGPVPAHQLDEFGDRALCGTHDLLETHPGNQILVRCNKPAGHPGACEGPYTLVHRWQR